MKIITVVCCDCDEFFDILEDDAPAGGVFQRCSDHEVVS